MTIFDTTNLINSINNALNNGQVAIPAGHKTALVANATLVDGQLVAKVAFAKKVSDTWQVSAIADYSHATGIEVGTNLVWSK